MNEHNLPTDPPPTTPSPPPEEESQAAVFAGLVGNMLEPIRTDVARCRHAAEGCFEAVQRVEKQLEMQALAIKELEGTQAGLLRSVGALRRDLDAIEARLKVVEFHTPAA